jgi:hypothetical protein
VSIGAYTIYCIVHVQCGREGKNVYRSPHDLVTIKYILFKIKQTGEALTGIIVHTIRIFFINIFLCRPVNGILFGWFDTIRLRYYCYPQIKEKQFKGLDSMSLGQIPFFLYTFTYIELIILKINLNVSIRWLVTHMTHIKITIITKSPWIFCTASYRKV